MAGPQPLSLRYETGPMGMLQKILDLPARSRSRLREAPASAGVGRSAKAGRQP